LQESLWGQLRLHQLHTKNDQPMPAGVLGLAVFFNGFIDHGYTLAVLAV
jgi:hypothetical protein